MAFSGHYPGTAMFDHPSQSYSTLNSPTHAFLDPELEFWDQNCSGWIETKQPMHRFLTEHDQGPTHFQKASLQQRQGVYPLPGSYRQESPRGTALSSVDSCASPPCETDFLQPQSPVMSDSMSPLQGISEQTSADTHLGYVGHTYDGSDPSAVDYHLEDPAGFFKGVEPYPNWPPGGYYPGPVQNPWQPATGNVTGPEVQLEHLPTDTTAIPSSTTRTTEESIPTEDCLIVNTQRHETPMNRPKRSRHSGVTTNSASTSSKQRTNKRRSLTEIGPVKRPRTKSTSIGTLPSLESAQPPRRNTYSCSECAKPLSFNDEQSLLKHRKVQHTRPFPCVYHFAGCTSTFATKNEWKRHVVSQHIVLRYWICTEGPCAHVSNDCSDTAASSHGTIFNRKDLYTQHLRRMHVPPEFKKQMDEKNTPVSEWERQVKEHQKRAYRNRCELPDHMECPVPMCSVSFDGTNAWDERMEHVARHLDPNSDQEQNATDSHAGPITVDFGGSSDVTLLKWSSRPDVAVIRWNGTTELWELNSPLRTSAGPRKSSAAYGAAASSRKDRRASITAAKSREQHLYDAVRGQDPDDEDAEGEEDDEYVEYVE